MACEVTWSPSARFDLREILAYIAEDDPVAGQRFVRCVFNSVDRLRLFPESGRVVPEFENPAIREVIRRPCRIVYRINTARSLVEIVRVWHAARGIPLL
jgi:plasmid stabilization system protein ParE